MDVGKGCDGMVVMIESSLLFGSIIFQRQQGGGEAGFGSSAC